LLPCAESAAEATKDQLSRGEEAASLSQEATVLVVEDESTLRQAVVTRLRKKGFSVIETSDGSAALEEIRAHDGPIDVLFLDITLPGTPSREVLEEALRLRPETRVIVTSAYTEDLAAESLQRRVERFMRKPYRFSDLMDLVRQSLS
jgi:DNA-binding NtrC family response regulator